MGHALLKKAILLLKMANVPFDLLIAVHMRFWDKNVPLVFLSNYWDICLAAEIQEWKQFEQPQLVLVFHFFLFMASAVCLLPLTEPSRRHSVPFLGRRIDNFHKLATLDAFASLSSIS